MHMEGCFHDLLLTRHSIRKYKDQEVSPDDVRTIIEAALLSPSSKSKRPWQFVIVDNREKLKALSKGKTYGAHALETAAFAVAVIADPGKSDVYVEDCTYAAALMQLQAHALGLGSCWIQVHLTAKAPVSMSSRFLEYPNTLKWSVWLLSAIATRHADRSILRNCSGKRCT